MHTIIQKNTDKMSCGQNLINLHCRHEIFNVMQNKDHDL